MQFLSQGIEVKMITGDHLLIGKETAKLLGMGTEMYPSEVLISVSAQPIHATPCMHAINYCHYRPVDERCTLDARGLFSGQAGSP